MKTARDAALALRFIEDPIKLIRMAWHVHDALRSVNESHAEEFATQLGLNKRFIGIEQEAEAVRNGIHTLLSMTSGKPRNVLDVIAWAMYVRGYNELDAERSYHVRNELLTSLETGEGWMSDLADKIEWRG